MAAPDPNQPLIAFQRELDNNQRYFDALSRPCTSSMDVEAGTHYTGGFHTQASPTMDEQEGEQEW